MKYLTLSFLLALSITRKGQTKDTCGWESVWTDNTGAIVGTWDCHGKLIQADSLPLIESLYDGWGQAVKMLNESNEHWAVAMGNIHSLSRKVDSLEKALACRPIVYLDSTSVEKPSIWVKDEKVGYDVELFPLKK